MRAYVFTTKKGSSRDSSNSITNARRNRKVIVRFKRGGGGGRGGGITRYDVLLHIITKVLKSKGLQNCISKATSYRTGTFNKLSYQIMSEKYEIRNSETSRGRGLFAKILFKIGEEVLRESCFLHQLDDKSSISFVPPSILDAALIEAAPFYGSAEPLGELTSSGYSPPTSSSSSSDKSTWTPRARVAESVLNANAFEVGNGRAFFPMGSFSNHSCSPNAIIQQIYDDNGSSLPRPEYAIIAREEIAVGNEIFISYVPRAWSKVKRQTALLETWGFSCDCKRCQGVEDDTVVFRCSGKCYEASQKLGDDYDGDAGGRVFLNAKSCIDCGGSMSPLSKQALDSWTLSRTDKASNTCVSEAMLEPLLSELPSLSLMSRVDKLLLHPFLAHEDVTIFTALCALMNELQDEAAKEQENETLGVEATNLFSRVARAVAIASMRTPFISPTDLGIEIVVQD